MVTNRRKTIFQSGHPVLPVSVVAAWPKPVVSSWKVRHFTESPKQARRHWHTNPARCSLCLPVWSDACSSGCGRLRSEPHFHTYVDMRSSSNKQMTRKTRYRQLAKCEGFLNSPDIQVQGIYFDGPCSGFAGDPQVGQDLMLRAVEADPFPQKMVFAVDVSRLTRNAERGAYLWEWGKRHNVTFRTLKRAFLYDESGERAWNREVEKAAEESRQIGLGVRRGRVQAAAEGRWDKRTPCGMKRLNGRHTLDPDVESIVRQAFLMRSQGFSVPKIANSLLNQPEWRMRYGFVKPDTHKTKVRRMLNDFKFAGYAPSLDDPTFVRHIRLENPIDLDQMVQPHLLKPLRADKDQVADGDFHLSGRLKCGHCGAKLVNRAFRLIEYGCEELLADRRAYVCPKTTCQPRQINDADVLHSQVLGLLMKSFSEGRTQSGLSAKWFNLQYGEHAAFIKLHFKTLFTVSDGNLALPKRKSQR